MASDDSLLRARSRSSLLPDPNRAATARQPEAAGDGWPDGDDSALLPQPGSPYDAAFSRPSNKPLPTLRLIFGFVVRGFPYANLDSVDWVVDDKPGASPVIILRFNGLVAREVRITGRNKGMLYDMISAHRISWVRELPKKPDFLPATATVITGITVVRIETIPD